MKLDELHVTSNIGVGTTEPIYKLDVHGSANVDILTATSIVGNASSATKLNTVRNIGGVSFDGTADIDLPGVNITGNQNTSGSAATLATARTIGGVSFDGSANIDLPGVNAAGNQNTTGSAAKLTTARAINGVDFDGSAAITVTANTHQTLARGAYLTGSNFNGGTATTWDVDADEAATASKIVVRNSSADINCRLVRPNYTDQTSISGAIAYRVNNSNDNYIRFCNSPTAIQTFVNVPSRTGDNASGTWGIDISGNAATATALETARTIGGVSFDGSANIDLPGVNAAGTQNTTGNAATATALETARTIGGVSFDGSANIDLPGVNAAGTQNTTGNATTATTATNQSGGTVSATTGSFSGNVGIGTTNPQTTLNVRGSVSTGRNLAREVGSVIAYSSQHNTTRGAANVINGMKHFEENSADWLTTSGQRDNAYVVIDLAGAYSVDRLVIYNQNEYSNSKREVKGFKLQGSTNNSTWTDVIVSECGRSNAHEANPGWSFRIPQNWDDDDEGSSYRYWKFIMTSFHGTDDYGGIMELELYEASNALDDEVSTSSLVAQDVYSETGNFSRGLAVGKGYGGTSTGANNLIVEGDVGIGTTDPSAPLDVVASSEGNYIARFKNSATSGDQDARIVIESSDADGEAQILLQTTNETTTHKWNIVAGSGTSPDLDFQYDSDFNGGTTAMSISHGGDVGIGTTSPGYKLDVNGTARTGALTATTGTFSGLLTASGGVRSYKDGVVAEFQPATAGEYTLVNFHSKVNSGSDKGFILVQDESANSPGTGTEDLRMTIGVHNDFRSSANHSDELWFQGGGRLVYNVGSWDSELNTIIGTPGAGTTGGHEWRVNNTAKMTLDHTGNLSVSGGTVTATTFSGNASTATKLATARAINGVNFDGSAAITITANTPQTLTRGSYLTGSNFNGGTATTWAVDATTANTASKIVARDANGDIFGRYLHGSYVNMSHASATRSSDTIFYSSTDNYIRKTDATGMRASLNIPTRTGGNASGTWGIDISGTAYNQSGGTVSATTGTFSNYVTTPYLTGHGYIAERSYTFNSTTNTTKKFLGWTSEDSMQISIRDSGWGHGGTLFATVYFQWGSQPSIVLHKQSGDYKFYYTYKNDRVYLWFNNSGYSNNNNVAHYIRMRTTAGAINTTEPGSTEAYSGTTIGSSAAVEFNNIRLCSTRDSNVGIGTTSPSVKLHVQGSMTISDLPTWRVAFNDNVSGNYTTSTTILWNKKTEDNRNGYSTTTGLYTVQEAGHYYVYCHMYTQYADADCEICFIINGDASINRVGSARSRGGHTTIFNNLVLMSNLDLNANDTVGVYVAQPGAHYNSTGVSYFGGYKIR